MAPPTRSSEGGGGGHSVVHREELDVVPRRLGQFVGEGAELSLELLESLQVGDGEAHGLDVRLLRCVHLGVGAARGEAQSHPR